MPPLSRDKLLPLVLQLAAALDVDPLALAAIEAAPVASSVIVSPTSVSIAPGGTQQLAARTLDTNGATMTGRTYVWSSDNTSVATVDSSGLVTGVGSGSCKITAKDGTLSNTAACAVAIPQTAPASVTPSAVTARSATLTIAAPSDVATNPVTSYNIYRNGGLVTNVAYSANPQTYNDSYINSPPGTMDSAGEPYWTWTVSAVRAGVESAVTASAATLVPLDGWHGDDVPGSGVLWSDTFQYASVAALNTAYGTSYVDGTNAAIDTTVTYNGRPTVKLIGDKRPAKTIDFHTTPSTDVLIRQVTNRGSSFALNQTRNLFSLHYDDGGASLEAYNAGGDSGNYVALLLNGSQFMLYTQAKTSGGAVVSPLSLGSVNEGPSTLMNVAQSDRRFWDLALRLTGITNGIRIRLYAGLESTDAGSGGGLQLIYDSGTALTSASVTGTVQIKSASFNSATDSAQASNKEWFGVRGVVDLVANPTAFGTLPTVVGYAAPSAPAPVGLGVLSFGPNGIWSSTNSPLLTAYTINSDADFRNLWAPADTSLVYSGNTSKLGTAAQTNTLVAHACVNADLMDIDLGTTYTDRAGQLRHSLHMKVVPSYFADTNPFLSDGVTLNPANDMCPASSHMPECNIVLPSGRSIRSWYIDRVFKFKNGFNLAAQNNTKSVADYGDGWTVLVGGTGSAQVAGVSSADQLKGMVFRASSGTGYDATDGGHFYQAVDTCDSAGNITFHGYNGEATATLATDSVLHFVGFNFTQSSACKIGPHPSSNQTRADLEMSNSSATLDSGNLTGTSGIPSERYNGGTDNNYTIGLLTDIFGANWATDEQWKQIAIAFRVTSSTTATLKVWAGNLTDTTLALKYSATVTFDANSYAYMTFCNWTGKNFNRQLAATDAVPEWWAGQTEMADLEESGWSWPSYIPSADWF